MIRFGNISRMIKSFICEVKSIGGTTQGRLISPKGLYSKPKGENALIINLANGTNQDAIIAIQKEVDLQSGDVIVTDDKSYIWFHNGTGEIEIKATKLIITGEIINNGKHIDSTHTHNGDSGGVTSSPL